jgi:FSR family fosmidomycin resistance protein-like MFS transporter
LSRFRVVKEVFNRWGGATALFFTYTHMSHDLCTGLLAALLPLIRADLGLSYLESGLLLSAYTITSGLSQFPGGWLGDRVGRRTVVAIGLGGVGLATLAVGLSSSYYLMLVVLIILGLFSGAYHPSATSMISGYFDDKMRGKAIALHMVGGSIGFAIGPVVGGLIADALDWPLAFILLSIAPIVAAPVVLRRFRRRKGESGEPAGQEPAGGGATAGTKFGLSGVWQALRPVAIITALVILTQLVAGCAMAFIPIYLVDRHGVVPATAAMLMSVVRVGGVGGSLLGGWLADKWSGKNALLLALVATGPVLYLLTNLPFNAFLMVSLVIFGLVMYMRTVTIQPLLMSSTPPHLRSTVFGIYFGLGMEGMSLAQPFVGHLMDTFGIVEVFHVIALVSIGLSVGALLFVKRPRLRRRA